jgi:NAD(P)-dependent dehydrogenase (short-subunit alcohol dehydrogenase family)
VRPEGLRTREELVSVRVWRAEVTLTGAMSSLEEHAHMLAYIASKGALIGIVRTLAVGLGSEGSR